MALLADFLGVPQRSGPESILQPLCGIDLGVSQDKRGLPNN